MEKYLKSEFTLPESIWQSPTAKSGNELKHADFKGVDPKLLLSKRQIGSLLYERTGLSSNKKGLILDTNQKAEQSTPEGIMRDPYVFEFVGLTPK